MTTLRLGLDSINAQAELQARTARVVEMHAEWNYREICPRRILASVCAVARGLCSQFFFKLAKALDLPSPTVASSTRTINHLLSPIQSSAHDFALDL